MQNARVLTTLEELSAQHKQLEITYKDESIKIRRDIIDAVNKQMDDSKQRSISNAPFDEEAQSTTLQASRCQSLNHLKSSTLSLVSEVHKIEKQIKIIES